MQKSTAGMTKQHIITLFVFLTSLGLAGCLLESQNPLAGSGRNAEDASLVGEWQGHPTKESQATWCPEAQDHFVVRKSKGMLVVSKIAAEGSTSNALFTTSIGKEKFVSICGVQDGRLEPPYLLARYKITGDLAVFDFVGKDEAKRAIESGKLKGTVEEKERVGLFAPVKETLVRATDTSEAMTQFIKNADQKTLYSSRCTFKRVK